MTDRLAELRRGAGPPVAEAPTMNPFHDGGGAAARGADPIPSSSGLSPAMVQFFEDVELTKKAINTIKEATAAIAGISQSAVLATSNEREAELSRELSPYIAEANKKASFAKQMLQHLRVDTERIKTSAAGKASDLRIRENLLNTLMRKFVDVMKDYQNEQSKYKSEVVKKVRGGKLLAFFDNAPPVFVLSFI